MTRRPLITTLSLVAALGLAACGSSSSSSTGSAPSTAAAPAQTAPASRYAAPSVADPPRRAAPLRLKDSLGHTVDLRDYRDKAVLVTFIYTHCPDVCPLIVGHLHDALARLGPRARDLQIIAVSTDPKGDTPATVARFLHAHQMTGRMEYLIGSRRRLERVWRAWGIAVEPDKANPELVEHSALIYGIDGRGVVQTLYPSNFKPAWIVHDTPLLASS